MAFGRLGGSFGRPFGASSGDGVAEDFAMLATLASQGKVVSAWILPTADPDQYLTLNGASVEGWAAAYGTNKVDLAEVTHPPQWDATLFSNKGGVTFNGTNQCLTGTGLVTNWPGATDDLWMLAAARQDALAADSGIRYAISYGATNQRREIGRIDNSPRNAVFLNVTGNGFYDSVGNFSGAHTAGALIDIGGTSNVYLDGTAAAGSTGLSGALTLTRVRMGAIADTAAAKFWSGAIAAAAVLNSTAVLGDFLALESEFRSKLS